MSQDLDSSAEDGVELKSTYCRICEPLCGLVATVQDGKLISLKGDKDDPHSKGFACTKGVSMAQVVYDPDRVTTPLRRVGPPGNFEPTTWDQALDDIAARFTRLRDGDGPKALAIHQGNPPAFGYGAVMWSRYFQSAVGTPWFYGVNAEDGASRVVAFNLLYGYADHWPLPDIRRTEVLVVVGANPWVSKGSFFTDPRVREHMTGIIERGGRVFVVDPRRTETARTFEHVAIRAGTDAWFLLSILHVLIEDGLHDEQFLARWTCGFDDLRAHALRYSPEVTAEITGLQPALVREIAEAIGRASAAVVYGRTGTCTQRYATLINVLQDAINIVTGNLQRPGGWSWSWSAADRHPLVDAVQHLVGRFKSRVKPSPPAPPQFGSVRTRVRELPDTFGSLPTNALADEISTPGEGRIRGMLMIGANPVVCGPGGQRLASALTELDTFAAIDLYVNETNKYADYILPCTTMYERADSPLQFAAVYSRPSIRITEAVIDPVGEAREEWEILDELARRMGLGRLHGSSQLEKMLAKAGRGMQPRHLADFHIRMGKAGDLFGLRRSGWSWKKLAERAPRGVVLHEQPPLAPLADMIKTPTGRIPFDDPRILAELDRLAEEGPADPNFPLRMIGMREMFTQNSWLHNAPRLMTDKRRHALRMSPVDASRLGLDDADEVRVVSAHGDGTTALLVTDDMTPGTVAMPHGWGHEGGWHRANAAGGANSNLLSGEVELLSGTSVLNGIPVRVEGAIARSPLLPAGGTAAGGQDSVPEVRS